MNDEWRILHSIAMLKSRVARVVLLTTVALIPGNKTFSLPSNFGYGILYIPAQRTISRQKVGNQ